LVSKEKKEQLILGLPVYNGEKFLEVALDSILNQTYKNYKLIITDNASTDNTEKICRKYVEKDPRITYYRNKKNMGATYNFNLVFRLCAREKTKYFKWIASDDIYSPVFLERCIKELEKDPSLILCHCETVHINEKGEQIGLYNYDTRIESPSPNTRYHDLISMRKDDWLLIWGVMKRETIEKTSLFGYYIGSDQVLLSELGLHGKMKKIPEYLFYRRSHAESYTEKAQTLEEKMKWWTISGNVQFPYIKILVEYFRSVNRSPITKTEKRRCYRNIIKWYFREGSLLSIRNIGQMFLGNTYIGAKISPYIGRFFSLMGFRVEK
jgi:glycosyltransferase involved in cell wall biosynthesis